MRTALLLSVLLSSLSQAQDLGLERSIFEPEANDPWSLAKGDLDGDGFTDLAISTSDHIGVYFNNGDGTFTTQQFVASSGVSKQVVLVDLDQDGLLDVTWVSWSAPHVAWARNLGGRTFDEPTGLFTMSPGGLRNGIAWGDLDQDGDLDLALAFDGASTAGLVCIRNNGALGFAQFPNTSYYIVPNGYRCGIADFTGDGELDVVAVGDGIYFLDNDDIILDATATVQLAAFTGGKGLVINDLYDDGTLDILASSSTAGEVWYAGGSGNGQFSTQIWMTGITGAAGLTVVDTDLDGNKDILVASAMDHTVMFRMNNWNYPGITNVYGIIDVLAMDVFADGGVPEIVTLSKQSDQLAYHTLITPDLYSDPVELTPISGYTDRVQIADLNGDGFGDLIIRYVGSRAIAWRAGMVDGSYGPPVLIAKNAPNFGRGVGSWDPDMDGDVDLIGVQDNGALILYRNSGAGVFTNDTISWNTYREFVIGDIDLDGDLDVICRESIITGLPPLVLYLNDGSGGFGVAEQIGTDQPTSMQLADLNGDSFPELVFYQNSIGVRIRSNAGDGTFLPATTAYAVAGSGSVKVLDLNGDGALDLIFPNTVSNTWMQGSGTGTFGPLTTVIAIVSGTQHSGQAFADLDGDGDLDAVTGTTINGAGVGNVHWYRNDGGSFNYVGRLDQNFGEATPFITLTDMDLDGDQDVFISSATNERISVLENFIGSPYWIEGKLYHDLNSDGAQNGSEAPFPFHALTCAPQTSIPFSNALGEYRFRTNAGTYAVSASSIFDLWQVTSDPTVHNVQLTSTAPIATNKDFGFEASDDSLWLDIASTSGIVRCGQEYPRWVDVNNRGNLIAENVDIHYFLDPSETANSFSPPPTSMVGNHLHWHFDEIPVFGTVNISMLSSTVTSTGNSIVDSLAVEAVSGSSTVIHTQVSTRSVLCSYDPNDKQVHPLGLGVHGAVDIDTRELMYTIRFQNTGTDTAFVVMLRDQLPQSLDPHGIRVIGSSHTITDMLVEADGELVFRFEDIELPDSTTNPTASIGYVVFAIDVDPDPPSGTVISNSAEIYFDVNEPVITNLTRTTLIDCDLYQPLLTLVDGHILRSEAGTNYQWFVDDGPIPGANQQDLIPFVNGEYTVEVTNEYGCRSRSAGYGLFVTSIEEQLPLRALVVPNPFSSIARVVFNEPIPINTEVVLLDMTGRIVRVLPHTSSHEVTLDRSGLEAGLYTVRAQLVGHQMITVRAMIE